MARPRIGPLAPLGRPRAALRRLDPRARGRRAHPLPGRRAAPRGRGRNRGDAPPAAPRGRGALPPADDPPGRGREPPPGATADPRAAARRARIAPPPGRGAHRAAGPRGRGGRRGARHDRGRPQPHPPRAARGLRTQRPGPPAGPLGAPHGHPLRRGQRRAVVAASGALRPPLAQPAGRGGGVDVRRGGGLPGERRAGRGDVHAAADGAGHLVGVRRPQRAGHRGLRHAALESGMAPRRGIPPLGGGRGGDPRLGRAPRAETPHSAARPPHGPARPSSEASRTAASPSPTSFSPSPRRPHGASSRKKAYICPRDDTRRICPAAHRRGAPRRGAASRARPAGGGARPPRAPRPHRRHAAQVPRPRHAQAPDVRGGGVHPPAARLRAGVERGVRAPQAPRGRLGARPHVRPGGRRMGPRAPLRPRGGTRARRGAGGRRPRELPAPGGRQRGGRRRVGRGVPGLLPRAVRLGLRRPRPPLGRGTQARATGGVLARHPGAAAPHPGRGAAPLPEELAAVRRRRGAAALPREPRRDGLARR